jgi:hypothetical protein
LQAGDLLSAIGDPIAADEGLAAGLRRLSRANL